ncbi:sigma-54-dependent transcriptional regulator [Gracilinema caldarium]|uniref:Two component, sigma54 specific, transcriptional regulator, Fis family n=1 Tax=Gracilinema caldarium (strain ATCC 51460 / DSM 7334 / H1) TaxID=744872 RepID=F8F0J5_GRAC1|nr:sigma-54 dependent transcriptional regulator [Gracilinema caldarium]AEJ19339.1 two component, sigma54 specific, transcriptional regulator, Fis family [Gracilinema caldarium DSM 7334]
MPHYPETQQAFKILIIDDEKNLRDSIAAYLESEGMEAQTAASGEAGKLLMETERFDAVVVDLKMPGMSGLDFLSWLKDGGPLIPAIMISAHGDIKDAVEAMKRGAADYLVKPFNPDELVVRLRMVVGNARLVATASAMQTVADKKNRKSLSGVDPDWIGSSPAMQEVRSLVERVAPTDSTVLVTGESGTGKEVVARLIHRLSKRADGPFIPINMGGIPENLIESELFGYEKGAFTGADSRKTGLCELASGGTLFLDEVGDMPLPLQVKILRMLQEKKIMRLGGSRQIPIDVRIIAATNKDLEQAVKQGVFREDLFYRLAVIRLRLPPLRDRREDIPILAQLFVDRYAAEMGRPSLKLGTDALELLSRYSFPGNVRELENAVERAVILCEGSELHSRDFSFAGSAMDKAPPPGSFAGDALAGEVKTLEELERAAILRTLALYQGHREKTAQALGITRRTLLNKLKEYQIEG